MSSNRQNPGSPRRVRRHRTAHPRPAHSTARCTTVRSRYPSRHRRSCRFQQRAPGGVAPNVHRGTARGCAGPSRQLDASVRRHVELSGLAVASMRTSRGGGLVGPFRGWERSSGHFSGNGPSGVVAVLRAIRRKAIGPRRRMDPRRRPDWPCARSAAFTHRGARNPAITFWRGGRRRTALERTVLACQRGHARVGLRPRPGRVPDGRW
jgi:hypothetical protein